MINKLSFNFDDILISIKKLFGSVLLLFFCNVIQAKNYYFSNTTGNDSRTSLQAQNIATPWQSIQKLNANMSILLPGDSVLFKRGDTFYGGIVATKSGTAILPIIFGAYGFGAKPVITGFINATGFTSLGAGVFESNTLSSGTIVNMVQINGMEYAMGRYPNADAINGGYLNFESFGINSITDNELNSNINWTGADVVIRSRRWTTDRLKIINHSGGTIQYATPATYTLINKYGYFIQNNEKTLDQYGEWYYNPVTNKIRIFFGNNVPVGIQVEVSSIENLLIFRGSNLFFENLSFEGANGNAIMNVGNLRNINLNYCNVLNTGINGLNFSGDTPGIVIDSCIISNSHNNGIVLQGGCINATLTRNEIINSGIYAGMGQNGNGNHIAIRCDAKGFYAENNRVLKCGYNGITFAGDNCTIKNNFIDSFCTVKDDGGGIYTFTGTGLSNTVYYNRKIIGNIIVNGVGAKFGVNLINSYLPAVGIYLDANTTNVDIINNTVANCANDGVQIHNARFFNVSNNTLYNNFAQFTTSSGAEGDPVSGGIVKNNLFISKIATQRTASYFSLLNNVTNIGIIDSNIYARPILDSASIKVEFPNMGWGFRSLAYWKTYSLKDANSKVSFQKISNVNDFDFRFNATNKTIIYQFSGLSKIDVAGNVYDNSVLIPAWESKVLLPNGIAPVANAGIDTLIFSPSNIANLTGIGTDADGTIISFAWAKISGPSSGSITTVNRATTALNSLVQGVYLFELTVTDNKGAIGKDTVQVTVNAALMANAGNDLSITLPVNFVNFTGTATDSDGSISSYSWTKITGPSTGNIVTTNAASTIVNSLVQGVYQFVLTVVDNNGAVASDTIRVTVNAAQNLPPVANAGMDAIITLPTNTLNLIGSGLDEDGTVVSFSWVKISGPEPGIINSPVSVNTAISNLIQGVYLFELTVTDNVGAASKDTVRVSVNVPITSLLPAVFPINPVNGIDYKYYEGSWSLLPLFNSLTPIKSGTATNFDISFANKTSGYGFNFTGFINIPVDGIYTFFTNSDDGSNLLIDNILTVSNDGLHGERELSGTIGLKAGYHAINGLYFQATGGQVFTVSYQSNDIEKQVIPATQLFKENLLPAVFPINPVNGIDYKYYEGSWSLLPLFNSLTPIKSGTATNFDISFANKTSGYGFNFTGFINIPVDGIYTFFTNSDDGSNLLIDNILTVSNDGLHGARELSGTIGLKAGYHAITGLYFQAGGGQVFTVSYQSATIAKQPIPSSELFRTNNTTVARLSITNQTPSIEPLNQQKKFKINVFPNPSKSIFSLKIDGVNNDKIEIIIMNISGQVIYKSMGVVNKIYQIGNDFLQGLYIIKVIQGKFVQTEKLIKL